MSDIERTYNQIRKFAQERGAQRVWLFGSRARGDAFPKSDIDIAVEGCSDFSGFVEDVQERLHSLLSIDTVNLDNTQSEALRSEIKRDGRLLYEAL